MALECAHRPGASAATPEDIADLLSFLRAGLTDLHALPERPVAVPSGLRVPVDGYKVPR